MALGKTEKRMRAFTHHDIYHSKTFKGVSLRTFADTQKTPNEALHIYRQVPINLRVNVITNPLLNAQILAKYVAKRILHRDQLSTVFKHLLKKMQK
jgi:hypothetical protein